MTYQKATDFMFDDFMDDEEYQSLKAAYDLANTIIPEKGFYPGYTDYERKWGFTEYENYYQDTIYWGAALNERTFLGRFLSVFAYHALLSYRVLVKKERGPFS